MNVIRLTATSGPDGILHLSVPVGAAGEFEVAVVVAPKPTANGTSPPAPKTPEELGWPPDYFENVIGSIDDETFVAAPRVQQAPSAVGSGMKYLLDTNVCVQSLRAKGSALVKQRLGNHSPTDIVVCSIVVGELCYGVVTSQNPAEQVRVDAFLTPYQSLSFDDAVARCYAELRALLEARGQQIADRGARARPRLDVGDAQHGALLENSRLTLEDWELP
jgi:predicted nucleic acid-binding protein